MLTTRREFVAAVGGLAVAHASSAGREATRARELLVHVGGYTERTSRPGVHQFLMDAESGAWRPTGAFDVGAEPSFLAVHPRRPVLYAVNELTEYEGRPSGAVAAFSAAPGRVMPLGPRRATAGGAPCYVALDHTGRWVFVANYLGGNVAMFRVADDGALGDAAAVLQHTGHGPDANRQAGPHAHCAIPDPTNRFLLAADLGADRIFVSRFDATKGTLVPAATAFVATRPGAGPRHLAFHPNGRWLYVANELDLTLATYRWDASLGELTSLGAVPMLESPPATAAYPADVHVAPSGRFVYASVRGDDSLVVFEIDRTTGRPTPIQRTPTGGRWPRAFAVDPSGRFLFVANQRSNDIVRFDVDRETGSLRATGTRIEVPAPTCIRFSGG